MTTLNSITLSVIEAALQQVCDEMTPPTRILFLPFASRSII
jgi:hypothetical protein